MRAFILWTIVRLAFFLVLDALFVHDLRTSLAFCGAFTLLSLAVYGDAAIERKRRLLELRDLPPHLLRREEDRDA